MRCENAARSDAGLILIERETKKQAIADEANICIFQDKHRITSRELHNRWSQMFGSIPCDRSTCFDRPGQNHLLNSLLQSDIDGLLGFRKDLKRR